MYVVLRSFHLRDTRVGYFESSIDPVFALSGFVLHFFAESKLLDIRRAIAIKCDQECMKHQLRPEHQRFNVPRS